MTKIVKTKNNDYAYWCKEVVEMPDGFLNLKVIRKNGEEMEIMVNKDQVISIETKKDVEAE